MDTSALSRTSRWRWGIAGTALVAAVSVAAGPAIGLNLLPSGDGGQPPAGTAPADPAAIRVELGTQPKPGTSPARGTSPQLGRQPANADPQSAGKPTQVKGPRESRSPEVRDRHGRRADKGGGTGADLRGGRVD